MRCCWPGGYEWEGDLLGTSKFGFGVQLHKDGCYSVGIEIF